MGLNPASELDGVKAIVLADTDGRELAGTHPPAESVAADLEQGHYLRTR